MILPEPFYREPRLIWIADRQDEESLRFLVVMELEHPARRADSLNEIYRVEGTIPVTERYDRAKVREYVMAAYRTLVTMYWFNRPDRT